MSEAGNQPPLPLDPTNEAASANGSMEEDALAFFSLAGISGVGESTLRQILGVFPRPSAVLRLSDKDLASRLAKAHVRGHAEIVHKLHLEADGLKRRALQRMEALRGEGIEFLLPHDNRYPESLRNLSDKPRWLFVLGDIDAVGQENLVAVVGSRSVARESIDLARTLSQYLAERGVGIVGGLAEGIDEVAHETALDFGVPTIAVLGHGINVTFPTRTAHLRQAIIDQGGAIVSEYLPGDSYASSRFVQRNRIQAGLSKAVCPVAANENSGTTHTYRFAQKYKRIVFGVRKDSAPKESGIHKLLQSSGYPIFDLDRSDDLEALDDLLADVLAKSRQYRSTSAFARLLFEFRRVAESYPITQEQMDDLVTELQRIWAEDRGGG